MKTRRVGTGIVAGGLLTLLTATSSLADETVIPAAPGSSDAVAVEIGPIKVGRSSAKAGPQGSEADSEATANAVELNGQPATSSAGGSQKGKGKKTGQVLNAGPARAAGWDAEVKDREGGGTRADSSASLLSIVQAGVAQLHIARSDAHAEHDGRDSKGWASSDGVRLIAGPSNQLELIVLHAETRSDNTGETYLASVNGTKVGTGSQLSRCPQAIASVAELNVNCVSATGAEGAIREVSANAVGAKVIPANQRVAAASSTGRSASGSAIEASRGPEELPAPAPVAASAPAPAPAPAPSGMLPRTGTGAAFLAAVGAAMAALGGMILALGRRFSLPRV